MAKIFCTKLKSEGLALHFSPIPGVLGQRILKEISEEAWSQWLAHQTILINEYRLNLLEPEAKAFLMAEMKKFLFDESTEKPLPKA